MSPTLFKLGSYRFFFFSREETRMHVHVMSPEGEAKFWLEPIVSLAEHKGLNRKQLTTIQKIVEERQDEIRASWRRYFNR
jgi:hypothetical protein